MGPLEISMLPPASADDAALMAALTGLINDVYAVAEAGLWTAGSARTTAQEVTRIVRAGQLAVARAGADLVGCVRIQILGEHAGEFGMLAVAPAHRGGGAGSALVSFAENFVREAGCPSMQLEVLTPREWSHPSKEFLVTWYTRLGYQRAAPSVIDEAYPQLAPLLATPCDLVVYRRDL